MKTVIVIPAFNEGPVIRTVIEAVRGVGYPHIVVVDDGSSDDTHEVASLTGVTVIRHLINRGLGGALGTGIQAALLKGADIVVTLDGDGQHDVNDIEAMIAPLKKGEADVVIGSRMLDSKGMPFSRRILNRCANWATFLLFGISVSDSQSGFRAFTRDAASRITIQTDRMEVSSELIREIAHKALNLVEVPIKVIYTEYSLSKGQNFRLGLKTFYKLVLYRLTR